MEDYIVRVTAAEGKIRAFACNTTEMLKEAADIHSLSPLASAALGRTMTAAAMMGMNLKGANDTVTLQIKGNGPIGSVVVISDTFSNVRGYVGDPQVDLPLSSIGKFDVASAVGKDGYLNVIKDLGLKEPYVGYVNLVSGEISEDLAYYFATSEQVPTVVSLGVLINPDGSIANAGGYIIELMPGAGDDIIDFVEEKVASVPPVTAMLKEGLTPEGILESFFGEKDMRILDSIGCRYMCNCSRERMERALVNLGEKELRDMLSEDKGAELQCHFCNKKYNFTGEDLEGLIEASISR